MTWLAGMVGGKAVGTWRHAGAGGRGEPEWALSLIDSLFASELACRLGGLGKGQAGESAGG